MKEENAYARIKTLEMKLELEKSISKGEEIQHKLFAEECNRLKAKIVGASKILDSAITELCVQRYVDCEFKIKEAQSILTNENNKGES